MQLTLYTDYSLRVLIFLAASERAATIAEIAERFGISRNHLSKVANNLVHLGYIHSMQGKGGGLVLAQSPEQINVADVIRKVEPNFHLVECFDRENDTCPITPACTLMRILAKANAAFFNVLDVYTLKDLLTNGDEMLTLLGDGHDGHASELETRATAR
jgi:Rrf2 family nitric oxide-sensitive transcriptional repressor